MEKSTDEIIERVNATMALEGMPLSDDSVEMLRRYLDGESTAEEERARLISKYINK